MLPSIGAGCFDRVSAVYVEKSSKELGGVDVKWDIQSHTDDIKQWNIIWYDRDDGNLHKTGLDAYKRSCSIPVTSRK